MMANGRKIKHTDLAFMNIQMVRDMKVIGKKTNNMEKVKRHGQMEHLTKVHI